MNTKKLINAWKASEFQFAGPVAEPIVNHKILMSVHGGAESAGNVCSLSAECNKSGDSCAEYWTKFKQAAQVVWMGFSL